MEESQTLTAGPLSSSKKVIPSTTQLVGLASWIAKPLDIVGPKTSNLYSAPSARDSVSRAGCGSHFFTSWESYSRSYFGGLSFLTDQEVSRTRRSVQLPDQTGDTPTPEEMSQMNRTEKMILSKGGIFLRKRLPGIITTSIIMTPTQIGLTKNRRLINIASKYDQYVREGSTPEQAANKIELERQQPAPQPTQPQQSQDPTRTETLSGDESVTGGPSDPAPSGSRTKRQVTARLDVLANTIPVRCVQSTSWKTDEQLSQSIPYSAIYTSIVQRLNDPSATGALGALARGPSIRDGTSLISLAAHLANDTGSVMEIAPVVRATCMGLSVSSECYDTDPIQFRVFRNFTRTEVTATHIYKPDVPPVSCNIMAVGVDIFTSFMIDKTGPLDQAGDFKYQNADVTWTAVPVRAAMMNQFYIIPYIASFVTSELWAGRTSFNIGGNYTLTAGANVAAEINLLPCANNVYIPGPADILLVLLDSSSTFAQTNLTIMGTQVPLYGGAPVNPVPFTTMFDDWFKEANVGRIPMDCATAVNTISSMLGVENSTNLGLSIAAELYGCQFNGINIPVIASTTGPPTPDYTKPGGGAYRIDLQDVPMQTGSPIIAKGITTNAALITPLITSYNFTGISPWCLPPTGMVKTKSVTVGTDTYPVWAQAVPDYYSFNYTATTVNSVARVAIAMQLVITTELSIKFNYGGGFSTWMHMLSGALCAQASTIFSSTNINLSIWTGYNITEDEVFSTQYMMEAIKIATNGIANFQKYQQLVNTWTGFDPALISKYFGLPVFEDPNWLSYHPLPYYYAVQWLQKHKSVEGTAPSHVVNWYHDKLSRMGLLIDETTRDYRPFITGSPNIQTYCPIVTAETIQEPELKHMDMWIDEFAYISNISAKNTSTGKPRLLTSQFFVLSPVDSGLAYTPGLKIYVYNSAYENFSPERRDAVFSPLMYPDPPTLREIVEGAKHWLLYPGLSALAGFVTGGPAGAAIAGGSHLAKNVLDRIVSDPDQKQQISEAVQKVARQAVAPAPPETTTSPVQALTQSILNPEKYPTIPIQTQTQQVPPSVSTTVEHPVNPLSTLVTPTT
uniref:Capsid protein n=1 Tax=Halyomorpha halys toti-like virus 2 TaxID=3051325 RepID=A0AA49FQ25_9VIRU|nr:MAG: capsid protein [Halyomorpha halys toti-like virus 2]